MARVRQFANDLGINYNQAKDLINKGRSRKDNGSRILDKTRSKMMKNGGEVKGKKGKKSKGNMCRGGGAALRGMKFSGTK